jgi:hypothetical protein
VFDPNALDDDLDDLLAPPPTVAADRAKSTAPPASPPRTRPTSTREATEQQTPPVEAAEARTPAERRTPRGSGGRPPASATPPTEVAPNALVVVAARIPSGLWQQVVDRLLSGPERPSYAQLITWTCQDHPKEVIDRLRGTGNNRTPRGRRVAMPVNTIAVRFRTDELATFDAVLAEAAGSGPTLTRTAGAVAAFEVALKHAT